MLWTGSIFAHFQSPRSSLCHLSSKGIAWASRLSPRPNSLDANSRIASLNQYLLTNDNVVRRLGRIRQWNISCDSSAMQNWVCVFVQYASYVNNCGRSERFLPRPKRRGLIFGPNVSTIDKFIQRVIWTRTSGCLRTILTRCHSMGES